MSSTSLLRGKWWRHWSPENPAFCANQILYSYGGHYGPVFNEYLEDQNALIKAGKLPGAHYIKLSTLTIGNGWYDPLVQYAAYCRQIETQAPFDAI